MTANNETVKERGEAPSPLFTKLPRRGLLGNRVARGSHLESVLMVKEKEPQRWEHQKNPTLEFLGFAGSA
jgi:hypothetical protein